jgi:D-xylose transport system permease protein
VTAAGSAPEPETTALESLPTRLLTNIRTGNLGSAPVILALALVVLVFSQTAQNFFSPANFTNIITQMAGTCLIAYGVVFVLLIGEIDLSVAFVSGVAGVVVAETQLPNGANLPWFLCVFLAILAATLIGAAQGSVVALIGVPSFVVTLAGYEIWQGVILRTITQGVIVIQDNKINDFSNYLFGTTAGWIMAVIVSVAYSGGMLFAALEGRRHGIPVRDPALLALKVIVVPVISFLVVWILNKDRGVPLGLLLVVGSLLVWTFVAKRTTFGRHVYAVGGNAEAARRAGIRVNGVRVAVFAISGSMAAIGGIMAASRLLAVNQGSGGSELLLLAIAGPVIAGTSLFGGRGSVWTALLGALVIGSISNGMDLLALTSAVKFMVTGGVLLLAVLVDAIARQQRQAAGRV